VVCYTENTDYVVESPRSSEFRSEASPGRQRCGLGTSSDKLLLETHRAEDPGEHSPERPHGIIPGPPVTGLEC